MRIYTPLIFISFLLSCSSSKKLPTVEYVTMDTITVSAKNNPMDIYRASETRYWDIIHTDAEITPDLGQKTAKGLAKIKLHPYAYPMDSVVLDAKSMKISSVIMNSKLISFRQQNDKLIISLDKPYNRIDTISIEVKYIAEPYSEPTGGSAAITDDRGLYFINTDHKIPGKPVQIWTQGETESNSHWLPTIDKPNERFTFDLKLYVADSFTTLSNGVKIKSEKQPDGLRMDEWRSDQPIQPYAIMFTIGKFKIVKDKDWRGKQVDYYVEPEYEPSSKRIFQNTPEMIEYFSQVTGVPYPWQKYSQVIVRDYVSGAMENTSASLFGEFMNRDLRELEDKDNEDVVSHELFHQWFGDYVTAESWSNVTLNESFANYGEQLWLNYKHGRAAADELALNDLNKYLGQSAYNDEPLARYYYDNRESVFDRISYEKGGAVLRYLHGLAGDDAFSHAMKIYLTKNALQPAEVHNWRLAVEEATGSDWNWFFNQWYFKGGHPLLLVRNNYDENKKELQIEARQTQADSSSVYNLPLKAVLIYGTEIEEFDWVVSKRKQSFTFPYKGDIKPLFIPDYYHWLPGTVTEKKDLAVWLQMYNSINDYTNKRRAVTAAYSLTTDSVSKTIFHQAINEPMTGIKVHALGLLKNIKDPKWVKEFKDEIIFVASNDGSNRARAAALDIIGKWKVTEGIETVKQAISDSSYLVAGTALTAYSQFNKDSAYLLSKMLIRQKVKSNLEDAVWATIAVKGDSTDIFLFRDKASVVYGTKKISLGGRITEYEKNVQSLSSYEEGLKLLSMMTRNENIKTYRLGLGTFLYSLKVHFRDKLKENPANSGYETRMSLADKYLQEVIASETDPKNLKKYSELK
jgi:aminopeptidase N